jgi:hypothetical protein
MKTYKLITHGQYVRDEETILENISTIEEFKNEIHNAAQGYHRDFDSVAFASQEEDEDEPTIIFENLLFTGHNCDCGIISVFDANDTDIVGYKIDDSEDDVIYEDEDDALMVLTNEDYSGAIGSAFKMLQSCDNEIKVS